MNQLVETAQSGSPDGDAEFVRKAALRVAPPWAERLVRLLDDGLRIPGTGLRFGLDGILGLVLPGAGDMATGLASVSLLLLALKQRVPTVILGRMVMNIGLDTLVGAFPVLGDIFDFFWKSNRRNLDLIERYQTDLDAQPSVSDYLLVTVGVLMAVASMFLPLVVLYLLGALGFFAFGALFDP